MTLQLFRIHPREHMMTETESRDRAKQFALEAFDTLFNRRDMEKAATFWSPGYIQHSAHIPPGRDGLFDLVRSAPPTMRYENHLVLTEGEWVMMHGRFSGRGDAPNWIAVDILRVRDGVFLEHWDVLQDEATKAESKSGLPMFGDTFPS
ncbi:MAG TPA: nuclear transport factor 2 family protein [Candidatus Elarobacter sp.]|nr:nuclear transport factor 2 family protein [Candidatus Elarobacter sp.]